MRHLLQYGASLCLTALFLIVIVPSLSAQTGNVQVTIEETNETSFPEVSLLISVTDAQGRAMRDLDPGNFVLTEDGKNVDIESLNIVPANQVELRVVMVLDISGSIAWKPGSQVFDQQRLDQVKQAAIGFVESLQPKDEIALVYFGDSAWTEEGFTPDHNKVINKLNNLHGDNLQNYTALYNGAFESIRLAGEQKTGRRAVVLMTDGKNRLPDGTTSIGLDTVVREASERHVRVYVIGVASPDLSEPDLRALTSDGRYYYVDQPEYLATTYNEIANELRHQYKIAFTSRIRADDQSHAVALSVRTPDGEDTTNTTYRSPKPTPTPIPAPTPETDSTATISPSQVIVALPTTITPGEAIQMTLEIPPGSNMGLIEHIDLYLNGTLVQGHLITCELSADTRTQMCTWIMDEQVDPGTYQPDVDIRDGTGNTLQLPGEEVRITEPASSTIPLWLILLIIGIFLLLLLILSIVLIVIHRRNQQKTHETLVMAGAGEPDTVPPPDPFAAGAHGKGATPARTEIANQPGMPMALLAVQTGKANPSEIRLSANQEYTIGRASDCSLVLDSPKTSSHHARIRFMENSFTIVDLGSTNGTWINGKRIERLRLQHNDTIDIGGTTLVYKSLQK